MEYYEAVNEVPIGNNLRLVKVKEQSPERCQEPGAVCLIEKNVRVSASCAQTALERRKTTAAATASVECYIFHFMLAKTKMPFFFPTKVHRPPGFYKGSGF